MALLGVIGTITDTGKSIGEFSLEWKITDFLSLYGKGGDRYESHFFRACDGGWCLKIYPNGLPGITSSKWVDLLLFRLDDGPSKTFSVAVGIKAADGVVEYNRERLQEISEDDNVCSWIALCQRSTLKEQKSRLMPEEALTIRLRFKTDLLNVTNDSSTQTEEKNGEILISFGEDNQGGEKALDDFGKLLSSGDKSDFTVQVGDVEFKVHQNILSVRNPVLSASIQHETLESASGRIVIENCEPEVFGDFLQYLYRGSVLSLTEKNVFGLYRIADRYLEEDLKVQCLKLIRKTLCVQTFCDVVKLSLEYDESDLLKLSLDYSRENFQSIVLSLQWQNFICEYPREANEIIIKSVVNKKPH